MPSDRSTPKQAARLSSPRRRRPADPSKNLGSCPIPQRENLRRELVGFAASQDTYKIAEPDPQGRSNARAITRALEDAKLSADDVDLIIPQRPWHPPARPRRTRSALKTAFGPRLPQVPMKRSMPKPANR